MRNEMDALREILANIEGISKNWFEWSLDGSEMVRTLVVQVDFDTDPESKDFNADAISKIGSAALNVLSVGNIATTNIRVVPKKSDVP